MARCWSCGSKTPEDSNHFTCPACQQIKQMKSMQAEAAENVDRLAEIQQSGFQTLSNQLSGVSDHLSHISTIMEWGFEELSWRIRQQTGILRSIDHSIKTPSAIRASELRQIAEELRERGLLDESEDYFLKSIESNPLDYRTYIGIGQTYLQMGRFDKAKTFWEKSLPHAPKQEIDYKSYSYRLIGHVHFCEDSPQQAFLILQSAIELSPGYADGHYDLSQYAAQIGNKEICLSSLLNALIGHPTYFAIAKTERNFQPYLEEVQCLLSDEKLLKEAKLRNVVGYMGSAGSPEIDTYLIYEGITQENESYIRRWDGNGNLAYVADVGSICLWPPDIPTDQVIYTPLWYESGAPTDAPTNIIQYEPVVEGRIKQTEIQLPITELNSRIINESEVSQTIWAFLHPSCEAMRKINIEIENAKMSIKEDLHDVLE